MEQLERGGGLSSHPDLAEVEAPSQPRSLLQYAPALVLFAIVIADAMRSADTDLWGHIFFGRIVLTRHQLWFHAPFSYACAAGPRNWIMHDWLGNLLMALVYNGAGIIGLKFAKLGCAAAMVVMSSLALARTQASLKVQAIVLLLAAMALLPLVQFRTYLADDVMLAALIAILASDVYETRGRVWLAVPMFVVWANLHGGFFVGLIILGLYALVRGLQGCLAGNGLGAAVRLTSITAAAALATLINPYGLRDWVVIAGVLRNPFTLRYISEFRPLLVALADSYHHSRPIFPFVCAITIMTGMLVSFVLSPRADDLALFAIAILMSAAALYAVRNTALAVIACAVPLCRHLDLVLRRLARQSSTQPQPAWGPRSIRMKPIWQIALAALAVALALRTGLLSNRMVAVEAKPVGALAFMNAHDLHGNVLCEFGWADYLLWHDARSKIFIESLFEAYYPRAVQHDYAAVNYAKPDAARVLDEYPNDFVLMPAASPASAIMMKQRQWRLIYRDPVAALFARAGSRAAQIPGVPVVRTAARQSFFP